MLKHLWSWEEIQGNQPESLGPSKRIEPCRADMRFSKRILRQRSLETPRSRPFRKQLVNLSAVGVAIRHPERNEIHNCNYNAKDAKEREDAPRLHGRAGERKC